MSDKDPLPIPDSLERLLDQLYILIPGAIRFACHRYQYNVSQDEFQDLFHEIIILLIDDDYHHLRHFDPGRASLKTWIYMIVKNYVRRHMSGKNEDAANVQLPGERRIASRPHIRRLVAQVLPDA